MLGLVWIQQQRIEHVKDENHRLSNNQEALLEAGLYYRTKDSLSVASVQSLTLTKNELEQNFTDISKLCDDLRIKVKRLQSASTTVSSTTIELVAPIRDTTIITHDGQPSIVAQTFRWRDTWTSIEGLIYDKEVACKIRSVDTLRQIVHRIPRKFLFIKYGTKAIRQEIRSSNPHSTIVYSEYIEIK